MLRRLLQITTAAVLLGACDNSRQGGLIGVQSPPTQIVFVTQPSAVTVNAAMTPAVRVAIQNASGQTVTSGSVTVTVTLIPGTGTAGANLVGGAAQQSFGGIVNFTNLRIDTPGTGYQLLASATGFPSIASAQFNVTP